MRLISSASAAPSSALSVFPVCRRRRGPGLWGYYVPAAVIPQPTVGSTMADRGQPRYAFRASCPWGGAGMAGPGGEIAAGAGGRGYLRASHADREQVISVLKAAFVQGLLDKDEFDLRVGQAFASRTYADLAALTADIPAGLITAQPPKTARESANKTAVKAVACGTAAFTSMAATMAAATGGNTGERLVGVVTVFVPFVAMLVVVLLLFHAWLDRRAGRRSLRGLPPGAGGTASRRSVLADSAGHLPQINRDLRHTAEAARSHPPRPSLSSRWPHRWRPLGLWCAIGHPGH
jgi:Domain of unknown function (DUF1707)